MTPFMAMGLLSPRMDRRMAKGWERRVLASLAAETRAMCQCGSGEPMSSELADELDALIQSFPPRWPEVRTEGTSEEALELKIIELRTKLASLRTSLGRPQIHHM